MNKTATGETTDAKALREAFEAMREALARAPEPPHCVTHFEDEDADGGCPR